MVDAAILALSGNSLADQANKLDLPQRVVQAIKSAAVRTGVDFSYLLKKAAQESGFDTNAKASTSSATGLYQFTNQTWLAMIKQHGAQYGLQNYADHISTDRNGSPYVSDPAWKQAILSLRTNPQVSANMAGELDKDNLASLKQNVGGAIGATELYLAHFLGAGGASDFLNRMKKNPDAKAANVLPAAASSNASVFYGADGQPKSLAQIYRHFAQKFDGAAASVTLASAATPPGGSSSALRAAQTVASAYSPSGLGSAAVSGGFSAMVAKGAPSYGLSYFVAAQAFAETMEFEKHNKKSDRDSRAVIS